VTTDHVAANTSLLRALVRVFETGNLADVDTLIAPDYIDHQGLDGTVLRGADGFRRVVTAARSASSNLHIRIEKLIADGDHVVARLRWHGSNPGGERLERETIDIIRVAGGRAVEHWGASVMLSASPGGSASANETTRTAARLQGLLLKESLADDSPLDLVQILSTNLFRINNTVPPQPRWWTEVRFQADVEHANEILQRFSDRLQPGWYLHCWTDSHIFVAFPGKVFTYARGDETARDEAITYGLSVGVPRHQLDWEQSLE
jgi:predicted SnoaL-like aldol condensation-catalyzing enzyme